MKIKRYSLEVPSEKITIKGNHPREVRFVLNRIATIRKEKGLSIIELAAKAEISMNCLSEIEKGLIMPSLMTLYKISKGLEVPLRALFEGVQK